MNPESAKKEEGQSGQMPENNVIDLTEARQKKEEADEKTREELLQQADELRARLEEIKKLKEETRAKYEAEGDPRIKDQLFRNIQSQTARIRYLEELLDEADHLKTIGGKI